MRPSLAVYQLPGHQPTLVVTSPWGARDAMNPTSATPPYSAIADALDKFHTASEPIQALMILAVVAMVLGLAACVAWSVTGVLRAWVLARRGDGAGEVVYGVYEGVE